MLYCCCKHGGFSSKLLIASSLLTSSRRVSSTFVKITSAHAPLHINLKTNCLASNLLIDKRFLLPKIVNHVLPTSYARFHTSAKLYDESKLEDSLKVKKKQKKEALESPNIDGALKEKIDSAQPEGRAAVEVAKPSLWQRFVAEVKHYYHGFRLLVLDTRIAWGTLWKIVRGKTVNRRERNQFRRAVADIFRLLPFSVFIVIPFAEIALPFVVKFFPGILPSTFETSSARDQRLKRELKVKLEMAKFLQDTVEDIAVHSSKSSKKIDASKKFVEFLKKTRNADEEPSNKEILEHAKLFKNDLTLDNIDRPQLVALCRLIQVPTVGTNEFLRLLLQLKLKRLHQDDELIMKEGVDSLTTTELMQACQARGMRAIGVPRKRLKHQLTEWVDLHFEHDVPSALLLLSRVLYLPDSVPAQDKVKAAISTLPEKAAGEAEVRAAELHLERVDNTARYKAAKLEQDVIKEEAAKAKQEKAAKAQEVTEAELAAASETVAPDMVKDKVLEAETVSEGPVLTDTARVIHDNNKITQEEIDVIDDAMSRIQSETDSTGNVKTELDELREDVEEYQTDVKVLTDEIKNEEQTAELRDTTAGKLLQKRINKMIGNMESILEDLEESVVEVKEGGAANQISTNELVQTIHLLTQLPAEKLKKIFEVLDTNKDGHINVAEATQVIKLLNQEDVEVTPEQLEKIVVLLAEQLKDNFENVDKITKEKTVDGNIDETNSVNQEKK